MTSDSQWTAERFEELADGLEAYLNGDYDGGHTYRDYIEALRAAAAITRERDQLRAEQWGRDMLCPKRPHEFISGKCLHCGEAK